MTAPTRTEALARYPVLRQLADLIDTRWSWMPSPTTIHGTRAWDDDTVDTILIRGETDAAALRVDRYGEEVWRVEGTLSDVVDALHELPDPGAPGAPRLAMARPPRLIRPW